MVAKSAASGGIKAKIKTKGDKYNTIVSIDTVVFRDSAESQNPESSDLLSEQDDINH